MTRPTATTASLRRLGARRQLRLRLRVADRLRREAHRRIMGRGRRRVARELIVRGGRAKSRWPPSASPPAPSSPEWDSCFEFAILNFSIHTCTYADPRQSSAIDAFRCIHGERASKAEFLRGLVLLTIDLSITRKHFSFHVHSHASRCSMLRALRHGQSRARRVRWRRWKRSEAKGSISRAVEWPLASFSISY